MVWLIQFADCFFCDLWRLNRSFIGWSEATRCKDLKTISGGTEPRTQAEDKTICWNKASMTSCAAPHCLCPSGPVVCLMKKSQISMEELDWNLTGKGNILTFRTSQKQGASTESWCSTIGIQLQICWNVEKHRIGENSDTNRIFSLYWTNNITFSFVGIFRF